jgi:cob(I)alamin adenosyltransferase
MSANASESGSEKGQGRAVKIYTKTGDDGTTGILGRGRVPKSDLRIAAYGTVDELNASLGVVRTHGLDAPTDERLAQIQNELFLVGSALADPLPDGQFHNTITYTHVEHLEHEIDAIEADLKPLLQFILPGGTPAAAHLHLARTVCRRAERLVVELSHKEGEAVAHSVIVYLNRLSDLLFMLARAVNHKAGVADVIWKGV